MSSQANVYQGAIANVQWATDRASISSGSGTVTYNVNLANISTGSITSNTIWSNAVSIGAGQTIETYVGAGNFLTITGASATTAELGTASSARAGIIGSGS